MSRGKFRKLQQKANQEKKTHHRGSAENKKLWRASAR